MLNDMQIWVLKWLTYWGLPTYIIILFGWAFYRVFNDAGNGKSKEEEM